MADISVVVCVKNEAARISECLASIAAEKPYEIILVDGSSTDNTVEIARQFTDRVIVSAAGSLCADRQVGIDAASCALIAMVDADHRLPEGSLQSLAKDLEDYRLDIVQSQLRMFDNRGFWCKAEDEMWQLNHNHPGAKEMIGTAPAIYRKAVFDQVRFDPETTKTIDDTDFIYRLKRDTGFKIGIGKTVVLQKHFSTLGDYMKKFVWYGVGDGEFCVKHRERMPSMLFHLIVRYPFIYSAKACFQMKWRAGVYCFLQGLVRFYGATKYFVSSKG